jgi:ATP-binding cassette subfamily F protein uup
MAHPPLISLQNISLTFGGNPLFSKLSTTIARGDKTCLVGRNGSGKSTFLKIICGQIESDQGDCFVQPGTHISYLSQEIPVQPRQTPREHVLASGCAAYEAEAMLDLLKINPDDAMDGFSGGERRRVALARALAGKPDVLLLDEPTNHLDLPTIEWLEEYLSRHTGALLAISHDRTFLERVSSSCLWLDRGILHRHNRGFKDFDAWTEQLMLEEEKQLGKLNTKLGQEMEWLHRGVTARRRRNQGRLRQLNQLREDKRQFMANQAGTLKLKGATAAEGSKMVVEARNISKTLGHKLLVQNFSTRIMRGDRIGIMGPNGAGKTTLVRMLAGVLLPDSGTIQSGATIDLIYYDQLRDSLDPSQTLWRNLCETGGEHVMVQGQPRHVVAYLKDFLFKENQVRAPVSTLSGGERNRLTLAKALTKPGNFLILDEPTNDLDMDTLDILIDVLSTYTGTLIVVSHDRDFLDKLTTSLIAVEGNGVVHECAGGYQDYIRRFPKQNDKIKPARSSALPEEPVNKMSNACKEPSSRVSYREKREYEVLPAQMDKLATMIAQAETDLNDASLYSNQPERFKQATLTLAKAREELGIAETRWLELDEYINGFDAILSTSVKKEV